MDSSVGFLDPMPDTVAWNSICCYLLSAMSENHLNILYDVPWMFMLKWISFLKLVVFNFGLYFLLDSVIIKPLGYGSHHMSINRKFNVQG